MVDICISVLILLGMVVVIGLIVCFGSDLSSTRPDQDSCDAIYQVGADAQRRMQDLSDDFHQRVIDLLEENRR